MCATRTSLDSRSLPSVVAIEGLPRARSLASAKGSSASTKSGAGRIRVRLRFCNRRSSTKTTRVSCAPVAPVAATSSKTIGPTGNAALTSGTETAKTSAAKSWLRSGSPVARHGRCRAATSVTRARTARRAETRSGRGLRWAETSGTFRLRSRTAPTRYAWLTRRESGACVPTPTETTWWCPPTTKPASFGLAVMLEVVRLEAPRLEASNQDDVTLVSVASFGYAEGVRGRP